MSATIRPTDLVRANAAGHRSTLRAALLSVAVVALYCLLTAAAFAPLLPGLTTTLFGPAEDNQEDFWDLWYAAVAHHDGGFFQTTLLNFPVGVSLHFESFAYPKIAAMAWLAGHFGSDLGDLILLHNLGLLISFPIAGLGGYLLLRHWTDWFPAAFIGGFIFAFSPSHVAQTMHHMHVQSIEFIPYFVLCYVLAIERRSIAFLAASLVCYALSALSCWYYLFYLAFFVVFDTAYVTCRERALPSRWHLGALATTFGGIVLVLSPLLIPMVRESLAGHALLLPGHDTYVADAGTWAVPAPGVLASRIPFIDDISQAAYVRVSGNDWEATNYLGIVNIVLVVWLLLSGRWRQRPIVLYAACVAVFFGILASGARLHVLGHRFLILPEAGMEKLPFFDNVRTPGRAVVFVYLFLAVLVGTAIDLLWQRRRSLPRGVFTASVIGLAIVLDFMPTGLESAVLECSPGFAILRDDPEPGFGVMNLPRDIRASPYAEPYMAEMVCHGRPIAEVYISRMPPSTVLMSIASDDLARQRQQLIGNRIKYIVLHRALPYLETWQKSDETVERYTEAYRPVYTDDDIVILRVY